ncbi:MAG: PucR family transcriptional regulator [Actinomycetales bacterium]
MEHTPGASLDGLQQIVDRLAVSLGRSVAIDDTQGRLLVASQHFGEEDSIRVFAIVNRVSDPRVMAHFKAHDIYSWTAPGRIPASEDFDFKARVCLPIRDHDILFGHLFLIDSGVTDDEISEAAQSVEQIGHLMYRRLVLHEEAQRRTEAVVRNLLADDPAGRQTAMELLASDQLVDATEPVLAVVVRALDHPDPERAQATLREAAEVATRDRLRGLSLLWVHGDQVVVLLFGRAATSQRGRALADAMTSRASGRTARAGAGRAGPSAFRVIAGVGVAGSGVAAAADSRREALVALRAAELLGPPDVALCDELGVYGLVLRLPEEEVHEGRYPDGLRRLLAVDGKDALIETLETYLDCGADASRAAAALCIHRSTLYYRLGRVETVGEIDLRDGSQRLWMHVGLKLRHVVNALSRS